jgi:hypothetical protein
VYCARLEHHLADCLHSNEYLAQVLVVIDTIWRAEHGDLDDEALDALVVLHRRAGRLNRVQRVLVSAHGCCGSTRMC